MLSRKFQLVVTLKTLHLLGFHPIQVLSYMMKSLSLLHSAELLQMILQVHGQLG